MRAEVGEEPTVLPVVGQIGTTDDDRFVTHQQQDAADDDTEGETQRLVDFRLHGLRGVGQFLDGVVQRLQDPHVDEGDEEGARGHHGHDPPGGLFALRAVLRVDVVLAEGVGGDEGGDNQNDLDEALAVEGRLGDAPAEAAAEEEHVGDALLDGGAGDGERDHGVPAVADEVPVVKGDVPRVSKKEFLADTRKH